MGVVVIAVEFVQSGVLRQAAYQSAVADCGGDVVVWGAWCGYFGRGADIAVVDAGWYAVAGTAVGNLLAASVILVSLLLASVALPYLLRGLELPEKSSYDKEEDFARKVSAQAALEAVERLRQRLVEDSANAERYNEAAHQVSQLYQRKLGAVDLANVDPQETKVFEQVVRRFRQVGLAAERDELFRLAREHNISDELLQRMVRNLDLIEARRRS